MNNLPTENKDLTQSIAQIIEQARKQVKQTVNSAMVQCYWDIGRLLVEDEQQGQQRAEYGKYVLQNLSERLTTMYGKGFDVRNLRNMRQFYLAFPIRNALRTELSWTHYRSLIRIEDPQAREWYLKEAVEQSWSSRALDRQISVLYYERLLASQNKPVVVQEAEEKTEVLKETIQDYLRDPYILDFLNLQDKTYQESNVEQAIINNLQQFLLELGKGFAFVERQKRIRFDDEDFYIDLVFYNFKLKCFLLIDLKIGKLKHQDIGQMDTYVRLYDEQFKGEDDNPTIGLVLCSEKSEAIAKYSVLADRKQIFSAKYLPYLPTELQLQQQIEKVRALNNV
ncbi:PDDEXK nuclease domain-containing protein [Pasteurella atlantica]|uniref:PDDEXK nuclease domain-containing protein n=1 Tax=Pasteurellaceae TaxID=712 RepID=UPI00276D9606|nr:PDDEXK nuclease domain-containing protein [Pasteurella atlantica]MDP8033177.1 PDDEXK nuclease domain-containing protein [Pasteurella atlantica]MDP8035114.1 PDDEXK nuclease domain-containing protein [Pasteurella atlantica]MDP8036926.1 PDDEXK nuclease domain-containing protein [Pasteurella atlantica]MDP8047548.1 PDDEXK nuclease domain-containing protein [Pasteurella atlantica]MDP8049217.1 PDDEXK nuclease domain-containing protein [Pasteurella atlantica]